MVLNIITPKWFTWNIFKLKYIWTSLYCPIKCLLSHNKQVKHECYNEIRFVKDIFIDSIFLWTTRIIYRHFTMTLYLCDNMTYTLIILIVSNFILYINTSRNPLFIHLYVCRILNTNINIVDQFLMFQKVHQNHRV